METEIAKPFMPPVSLVRIVQIIGLIAVLLTAFSYAFVPLRESQDEWWHLKTGKWMLENKHYIYQIDARLAYQWAVPRPPTEE